MIQNFEFNEENTFCISLEKSNERWKKMQERFNYFNISATKWNACSKPEDITDTFFHSLSVAQKGCAQSHLNIYKHMKKNNIAYALILEDDACFDKEWQNKISTAFSAVVEKDPEWHAIFLNASEPISSTFEWKCISEQYLTAGYIISQNGCNYILNYFENMFFASDWMTTRMQLNGHCYSYFPWLIIQEGNESNIGNQFTEDRKKVINCLETINYNLTNYI
jgi:GR25 family glycosyltransferase involved in LPS biosynthesis